MSPTGLSIVPNKQPASHSPEEVNSRYSAGLGDAPLAIRGIAALIVAIGHCWAVFLMPIDSDALWLQMLGSLAAWAVATFFILSGMVIAASISRRVQSGVFALSEYLQARTLRIFPPLLVAVVITVACVTIIRQLGLYGAESYLLPGDEAVMRDHAAFNWPSVLLTVTLLYNLFPGEFLLFNGPLWSLSYEYWLYVLAGLVFAAAFNRSLVALGLAIILVALMALAPPSNLPFWGVGLIWGAGFVTGWHWRYVRTWDGRMIAGAVAIFVLAALLIAGDRLSSLVVSPYGSLQANCFYLAAGGALLGTLVLVLRLPALRRTENSSLRVAAWIGRFSYTLYLVHFPLFLFAFSVFRPFILDFGVVGHACLAIAALGGTLLISWQLARWIEDTALMRKAIGKVFGSSGARSR
jgi:peptidoglycan/LPS O-acetylase OafA/YrhL